jgi:pyruvate dehydrogenase E1 component beta subunit
LENVFADRKGFGIGSDGNYRHENPGFFSGKRAIRSNATARTSAPLELPGAAQLPPTLPSTQKLMFNSLREAIDEEMARDKTVCILGEDVGHYGGSYKVSSQLYQKYGDLRVLDTPICENAFLGQGVGMAMMGLNPIVEGMNMGFLLLGFNQISNNCGMLHYTSGGQFEVPMVIRGPGGVGKQLGAEHSQRLEAYFQSVPGLQMVACSTPRNAKALLKAAIRSKNPVMFYEHVLLYNLKDDVPDEEEVQSLERAELVRPGTDLTIFTYGRMRHTVMEAVKELTAKGYDPEVIDLISLKPIDMGAVAASVRKTKRALIVEECYYTGGIGASLTRSICDELFYELQSPIKCLSSLDVPTPYAASLEDATIVLPQDIIDTVEAMKILG